MGSSHAVRLLALAGGLVGCATEDVSTNIDRLYLVGEPVALAGGDPTIRTLNGGWTPSTTFTHVATVEAPELAGRKVQATNFAVAGNYAYVVYNTAGTEIAGGIDVIDVSHVSAPELVGSHIDSTIEFAAVAVKGPYAYAVGSRADGGVLVVWDVHAPASPTRVATLALGSQYVTSIEIENHYAYVTIGAEGGVAVLDITKPTAPTVVRGTRVGNALYLRRTNGMNLVLGGSSAFELAGERDGTVWPMLTIADAPVAAPGRFATSGTRLFTNAGHTGLTTVELSTSATSATLRSHVELSGTGNGLDTSHDYLFLAQGEAGALVYSLDATPRYLGRFDFPDEPGSANQIRYAKHVAGAGYLFLVDGLGGFRILSFDE